MKDGDLLENLTMQLYERMGFQTEQKVILQGRSGSIHEIDVIAKKKSWRKEKVIFTECKFRSNGYIVGKADLAKFLLALDDIGQKNASVITNSFYSDNAVKIADRYNLTLVNGDRLRKLCGDYKIPYNIAASANTPVEYLVKTVFDILEIGNQKT